MNSEMMDHVEGMLKQEIKALQELIEEQEDKSLFTYKYKQQLKEKNEALERLQKMRRENGESKKADKS